MISRLKELRETLGLSMPAFGRRLGCSRDVIANIEYGRVQPKEVFLDHVCEVFSVNPQWLYTGQGEMLLSGAAGEQLREVAEIFHSLSPDLQELALSQMKSLQKLMAKKPATAGSQNDVDTIRLMAAMLDAEHFDQVGDTPHRGQAGAGEQVACHMKARGWSNCQLAEAADLPQTEVERVLCNQGPARRDTLVRLAVGLSLDVEETQRLLTAAGQPALYAKNRRDSACIFALVKGLQLEELNQLLTGLEEPTL